MNFEKLYIDGQWVDGASGEFIDVENRPPVRFLPAFLQATGKM